MRDEDDIPTIYQSRDTSAQLISDVESSRTTNKDVIDSKGKNEGKEFGCANCYLD